MASPAARGPLSRALHAEPRAFLQSRGAGITARSLPAGHLLLREGAQRAQPGGGKGKNTRRLVVQYRAAIHEAVSSSITGAQLAQISRPSAGLQLSGGSGPAQNATHGPSRRKVRVCFAGDGEGAFRLATDPASASDLASEIDWAQGDVASHPSVVQTGNGDQSADGDDGALREEAFQTSTSTEASASLGSGDDQLRPSWILESDSSRREGEGPDRFIGTSTGTAVKLALRGGVEVLDLGRRMGPESAGFRLGFKSMKKYKDKQFLQSVHGSPSKPSYKVFIQETGQSWEAESASAVWRLAASSLGYRPSYCGSRGMEFFGLSHPAVIEAMTAADGKLDLHQEGSTRDREEGASDIEVEVESSGEYAGGREAREGAGGGKAGESTGGGEAGESTGEGQRSREYTGRGEVGQSTGGGEAGGSTGGGEAGESTGGGEVGQSERRTLCKVRLRVRQSSPTPRLRRASKKASKGKELTGGSGSSGSGSDSDSDGGEGAGGGDARSGNITGDAGDSSGDEAGEKGGKRGEQKGARNGARDSVPWTQYRSILETPELIFFHNTFPRADSGSIARRRHHADSPRLETQQRPPSSPSTPLTPRAPARARQQVDPVAQSHPVTQTPPLPRANQGAEKSQGPLPGGPYSQGDEQSSGEGREESTPREESGSRGASETSTPATSPSNRNRSIGSSPGKAGSDGRATHHTSTGGNGTVDSETVVDIGSTVRVASTGDSQDGGWRAPVVLSHLHGKGEWKGNHWVSGAAQEGSWQEGTSAEIVAARQGVAEMQRGTSRGIGSGRGGGRGQLLQQWRAKGIPGGSPESAHLSSQLAGSQNQQLEQETAKEYSGVSPSRSLQAGEEVLGALSSSPTATSWHPAEPTLEDGGQDYSLDDSTEEPVGGPWDAWGSARGLPYPKDAASAGETWHTLGKRPPVRGSRLVGDAGRRFGTAGGGGGDREDSVGTPGGSHRGQLSTGKPRWMAMLRAPLQERKRMLEEREFASLKGLQGSRGWGEDRPEEASLDTGAPDELESRSRESGEPEGLEGRSRESGVKRTTGRSRHSRDRRVWQKEGGKEREGVETRGVRYQQLHQDLRQPRVDQSKQEVASIRGPEGGRNGSNIAPSTGTRSRRMSSGRIGGSPQRGLQQAPPWTLVEVVNGAGVEGTTRKEGRGPLGALVAAVPRPSAPPLMAVLCSDNTFRLLPEESLVPATGCSGTGTQESAEGAARKDAQGSLPAWAAGSGTLGPSDFEVPVPTSSGVWVKSPSGGWEASGSAKSLKVAQAIQSLS